MARPKKQAETVTAAEIYQDKHGMWHGWVEFPDPLPNGKRDRRHRMGRDEEKVREKIKALEDQRDARLRPAIGRPDTVQTWFTTWLTDIAPYGERALRPRSLDDYWSRCRNWIFPHLGHIRLPDLVVDDLDRLYAAMRKAGKAPSHILKVHAIVSRGLTIAVRREKVARNVAGLMDKPGTKAPARKGFSREEVLAILGALAGRRAALRFKIGFSIGPRQGEVLALRWQYVDFAAGMVDVAWQIQRRTWKHGCKDPAACAAPRCRTKPCEMEWVHGCKDPSQCRKGNGTRTIQARGCPKRQRGTRCPNHTRTCPAPCPKGCTGHGAHCPSRTGGGLVFCRPKTFKMDDTEHLVALPPSLMAELQTLRRQQIKERDAAGTLWEEHDLVFCRESGRPIDPRDDWEEWREILQTAGVRAGGTHLMRHSAAEMMRDAGVSMDVIQVTLGHADSRTTGRYAKGSGAQTVGAARTMDSRLFGVEEPAEAPAEESGLATDLATERKRRRGHLRAV